MQKEIGSEFWSIPVQSNDNFIFPTSCIWFLSGRMALSYILLDIKRKYSIKTATLPSWCCDSMIIPFLNAGFEVEFYSVNFGKDGLIQEIPSNSELILVMDYFGFCNDMDFSDYSGVVIRDLTQSIFCKTYNDADYYFGSLRKWCGILTGGFAFGQNLDFDMSAIVPANKSYLNLRKQSMESKELYIAGKTSKKDFLYGFSQAEKILDEQVLIQSSTYEDIELARKINIDFIKNARRNNANTLLSILGNIAVFPKVNEYDCPLFVPIVIDNRDDLKRKLIENKIYCPTHWPISDYHNLNSTNRKIYANEISIVCDQRYDTEDMLRIANVITEGVKKC